MALLNIGQHEIKGASCNPAFGTIFMFCFKGQGFGKTESGSIYDFSTNTKKEVARWGNLFCFHGYENWNYMIEGIRNWEPQGTRGGDWRLGILRKMTTGDD